MTQTAFIVANKGNQKGATLIEVLVAIVIFSVGVMGLAALQLTSLVQSDDTRQRSIALWKAQELVSLMRATKTISDPDGEMAAYIAEIGNNKAGIGVYDESDIYTCPAAAPTRCDLGNSNCSSQELVTFDVWGVMCSPNEGLAVATNGRRELAGLQNVEVALIESDGEFRLYLEWLSRTATRNVDDTDDGIDSGLNNEDGSQRSVTANLCGDDEEIDNRLEAYCVRFE